MRSPRQKASSMPNNVNSLDLNVWEAGFTDIEHFYHAMNWHGWVAYA